MNIDTRYEETKLERWIHNTLEILITVLMVAIILIGLSGCVSQSDKSVSNAANQCYPNGLYAYVYHGGTGSLQVVCK